MPTTTLICWSSLYETRLLVDQSLFVQMLRKIRMLLLLRSNQKISTNLWVSTAVRAP